MRDLVVVGPGVLAATDRAYITHLTETYTLPVRYAVFRRGDAMFDV